jgi:hypothetical protein
MSPAHRLTATRRLSVAVALTLAWTAGVHAATQVDPRHRFRSLATPHFIIYFHQGEGALATRLAGIAEDTWRALRAALGTMPRDRTHVVLADETEEANGSAFPLPYNTVRITAAWPRGSDYIGRTDDWLRLVFAHEFAHIVHLDRSEGWARVVRNIFGRTTLAFPNLFLPAWQIEGLATYEESAITGAGRLHAGDFLGIVGEAARASALEPLDRLNGGLTDWPDGFAPYAYGLGFHAYLAERFGTAWLADMATATAGRVPFTTSPLFERVLGRPFGALWRDFEAGIAPFPANEGGKATRLTRHGFAVEAPRFVRGVCEGCPDELVYSVRTPHEFPTLNQLSLDSASPRRLTTRYRGSSAAATRAAIYFDQQELRRNSGLYSDLYVLDRASGSVTRLTRESRLLDPDLSPDQRTLVCVRHGTGRRDLVLVQLKPDATSRGQRDPTVTTLVSEPNTQFNAPRWSPDGRMVAVERHRPGSLSEIVVVDVATREVGVVAAAPGTRFVTPAWRPDGGAIVVAAAPDKGPFDLFEIAPPDLTTGLAAARRLTQTAGGALWPDVSPDGRAIVYVGYTTEGFDLFRIDYPTAPVDSRGTDLTLRDPAAPSSSAQEGGPDRVPPEASAYSPLATLKPTSWSPIITGDRQQLRVGATTDGLDVLGYHAYSASATWLVTGPSGQPGSGAPATDWQVSYAYDRWRPTLWASASRETSFFAGPATDANTPSAATRRALEIQAGMLFPVRHVRTSVTALASIVRAVDDFVLPAGTVSRDRTALRGAWSVTSARQYGYSISPERGIAFGATAEIVRRALGSSGDAGTATVDGRVYLPGLSAHHVTAIRVAAGTSDGDPDLRRSFHLGGAAPNLNPLDFGREAISLLRGFPSDTFAGRHVALLNADYRWPIVRPQRGPGAWPLFLHTMHAAVFADAGHAWTGRFDFRDLKTSAGAELSANVVAGYSFPFTATVGAAWGRDGRTRDTGTMVYVRVGRAF